MREIVNPENNEVYMKVEVRDGRLRLCCTKGSAKDLWYELDAKAIPYLRQILTEAEFFKYI
jgi:hypothetical protein